MNNKRILIITLAILSQQAIQAITITSNNVMYSKNDRKKNASNCKYTCANKGYDYKTGSASKDYLGSLVCECVKK